MVVVVGVGEADVVECREVSVALSFKRSFIGGLVSTGP